MADVGGRKFAQLATDEREAAADAAAVHSSVRRRLIGVACAVASAACFAMHGCVVRVVSDAGFSTLQVCFAVGCMRTALACVAIPARRRWRRAVCCKHATPSFIALVVFRQLVGCATLVCIITAFATIPLGEATSMVFTAPVWTTLLAWAWLGEPVTRFNLLAAIGACVGVALVATAGEAPGAASGAAREPRTQIIGSALALLGAFLLALVTTATRCIGDRLPAVVLIFYYGLALALMACVWSAVRAEPILGSANIEPRWWALLLLGAALSFVAQLLVTMALQRVEAGPINVCSTLEIVFSFAFQATLLATHIEMRAVLGALVIFAASALVGAQRVRADRVAAARPRAPSGLAAAPAAMGSADAPLGPSGVPPPLPPVAHGMESTPSAASLSAAGPSVRVSLASASYVARPIDIEADNGPAARAASHAVAELDIALPQRADD